MDLLPALAERGRHLDDGAGVGTHPERSARAQSIYRSLFRRGSVYRRYAIVSEAHLSESVKKLATFRALTLTTVVYTRSSDEESWEKLLDP